MNIFVLDTDPNLAAKYHCDKHVVKMVLETAQLLCSAYPEGEAPYKRTHYNHPCAKWARETSGNYFWLAALGHSLSREYTHRYGKYHKSSRVINWCLGNMDRLSLPQGYMTDFVLAMPDEYKLQSVVDSYRWYYVGEKGHLLTYKNREEPEWLQSY